MIGIVAYALLIQRRGGTGPMILRQPSGKPEKVLIPAGIYRRDKKRS